MLEKTIHGFVLKDGYYWVASIHDKEKKRLRCVQVKKQRVYVDNHNFSLEDFFSVNTLAREATSEDLNLSF